MRKSTLLLLMVAFLTLTTFAFDQRQCRTFPVCDRAGFFSAPLSCKISRYLVSQPLDHDIPTIANLLNDALKEIIGQPNVVQTIFGEVVSKLREPTRPLVLHLAGDNGVGKTMTAHLISLATSFREAVGAGGEYLGYGNNLLKIAGSAYSNIAGPTEVSAARNNIFRQVSTHLQTYPKGIILLDDANTMHPDLIEALGPVLGRGELPTIDGALQKVSVNSAIIILTSDFGKEGRTRGMSASEITRVAKDELKHAYSHFLTQNIKTVAFLPFGEDTARNMVEHAIKTYTCREPYAATVAVDPLAVEMLTQLVGDSGSFAGSNGRAVEDVVREHVDNKVGSFVAMHSYRKVRVRVLVRNSTVVTEIGFVDELGSAFEL